MAITFTQERKKQKYLILILALAILAILLIVWWGFSGREEVEVSSVSPVWIHPQIKINWQALKDPQLAELQAFEGVPPLIGETGRKNPFVPY